MKVLRSYAPAIFAAIVLCVVVWLIFPYYKHYIDPDAVAYLTISERYANGEWMKAINGYWSPWSCWLTAVLIKFHYQPFASAIIANTIGAIGYVLISRSFFSFFKIRMSLQWVLCVALAFFLSYAIYKQTFDDLWECFFLLACLRIMLDDDFVANKVQWFFLGVMGALAYMAKAYSFPFFIANTIVINFIIANINNEASRKWIIRSFFSIAVMFVLSLPWIWALHEKYGEWMTSTAGELNLSWYLLGHPVWKPELGNVIPPVYVDSPYYWEDPYISNGPTPQFWQSPKLFALLIVKCILNFAKFIIALSQLSPFAVLSFLAALAFLISKQIRSVFSDKTLILSASFILFPLGFLIINYESRYIWYMLPISMTIGALLFQRLRFSENQKPVSNLFIIVFAASYLVWPLLDMKQMWKKGYDQSELAQKLSVNKIKGSFTTVASYSSGQIPNIARLAYMNGCQFYYMPYAVTKKELLRNMKKYNIKYYFHFPVNNLDDHFQLTDELGNPFPEIQFVSLLPIKVFVVNP